MVASRQKTVPLSFLCGTCKLSLCSQCALRGTLADADVRLLTVFGLAVCFSCLFFDMIHSLWDPELKQQYYFLFPFNMFLTVSSCLGSE